MQQNTPRTDPAAFYDAIRLPPARVRARRIHYVRPALPFGEYHEPTTMGEIRAGETAQRLRRADRAAAHGCRVGRGSR